MENEIQELKDIVHNGTVANQYSNTLVSLHTKELQQFNTRYLHIYNILGVILYLLVIFFRRRNGFLRLLVLAVVRGMRISR